MQSHFTEKLIEWHYKQNKRIMPWKGEKDPYKIWISEIILQQTRVKQGLLYYNNFIAKFPTIESLASAADEDVFKVWEGLGYYTRCRNILITARFIQDQLNGKFPEKYENIIALKGIGPYTAAAISSFAYGLPHAVVDGNVFRVLARFFGEVLPIDSVKGKHHFNNLAKQLLFIEDSAAYNQAIMDFGATVCKPQIPDCQHCVLQNDCISFKEGLVNQLPIKEKVIRQKKRWFTYFIFKIGEFILVKKRIEKDIWQGLYEFYLYETSKQWNWTINEVTQLMNQQLGINTFTVDSVSQIFTQQLTHQNLEGKFIILQLSEVPASLQHFLPVKADKLSLLAFPKFINQFLQQTSLLQS